LIGLNPSQNKTGCICGNTDCHNPRAPPENLIFAKDPSCQIEGCSQTIHKGRYREYKRAVHNKNPIDYSGNIKAGFGLFL
jgi:hypothetical protein